MLPYGKIFSDSDKYYVSFYSINPNQCEWLVSSDTGKTWTSKKLIYSQYFLNGKAVEPFFDIVRDNVIIGLIRDEGDKPNAWHQMVSFNGGKTFSKPTPTNIAFSRNLKTAPSFYYDRDKNLIIVAAGIRNENISFSDTNGYRLISYQLPEYQSNLKLYGYSSIEKVSPDKYYISYTERVPVNPVISNKSSRFVEQAWIYQSYLDVGFNSIISPTIKDRRQNFIGVFESRNPERLSIIQNIQEAGELHFKSNNQLVLQKSRSNESILKVTNNAFDKILEIDSTYNFNTRANINISFDRKKADQRWIQLISDNSDSTSNGFLRLSSNTSTYNSLAPILYGKSNVLNTPGIIIQGDPKIQSHYSTGILLRVKSPKGNYFLDGVPITFYNWTTRLGRFLNNGDFEVEPDSSYLLFNKSKNSC